MVLNGREIKLTRFLSSFAAVIKPIFSLTQVANVALNSVFSSSVLFQVSNHVHMDISDVNVKAI